MLLQVLLIQNWLFAQNLERVVKNSRIFQMNDATVRSRFEMELNNFSISVVMGTKVIAHGLLFERKVLCDTADAACGQRMLDAAKFLESNIHRRKFK